MMTGRGGQVSLYICARYRGRFRFAFKKILDFFGKDDILKTFKLQNFPPKSLRTPEANPGFKKEFLTGIDYGERIYSLRDQRSGGQVEG